MHTFPKSMSTMWNANGFAQDLKSGRRISFDDVYYTMNAAMS